MLSGTLPRWLRPRHLVLALALANAVLYCCVLPLWEGFDEPFHYGYIETIAVQHRLPVFRKATISAEIDESLRCVPLSRFLSEHVAEAVSFEDYAKLSQVEKLRLRKRLEDISPKLRESSSDFWNYEAQQAPLAYLALTACDAVLSRLPLAPRILSLRLIGALGSTVLLYFALRKLARLLALDEAFETAAMACVFASQALWASIAHVGNDWLAVPLTLGFLAWLAATAKEQRPRDLVILATILGAGLLTKAYFLAFVPVFVGMVVRLAWRRAMAGWKPIALAVAIPVMVGGPWYLHNLLEYGSLSGTQQGIAGIGWEKAMSALPRVPWVQSVPDFLRWSLWTGNWSFLSFSRGTLNLELVLVGLAIGTYFFRRAAISSGERWLAAGCASMLAAMVYQTCVTWVESHGVSTFAEPWYWQGMIPCVWLLAFRGLQGTGVFGRICGTALGGLTAWIAAITYPAKLIPFYAGGVGRATLGSVMAWWLGGAVRQDLETSSLAPAAVVCAVLGVFLFLFACALTAIWRGIWASGFSGERN